MEDLAIYNKQIYSPMKYHNKNLSILKDPEKFNLKNILLSRGTESESTSKSKFSIEVSEEWSEFLRASYDGDIEEVKTQIESCINEQDSNGVSALINMQDNDGLSALIIASHNGHTKVVKLLLEKGAQINMQDDEGLTALMAAISNGHTEVVQLLIKKGAQINMLSNDGFSALMMGCFSDHTEIVKLLLKKDAQTNVQEKNQGFSALMIASVRGNTEVVQLLIKKGAKINMLSNDGISALMIGCVSDHTEIVKLLLKKDAQINIQEKIGRHSALMIASESGNTEVVELLLKKGAQIDMQDNNGLSALMIASADGHTEMVELLVKKDAQINMQDNIGQTALIFASKNGHTEVIKLLLENDALINMPNNVGWSALMIASQNGLIKVVELLLEKDAWVDMPNDYGLSALMTASWNGHTAVVQLLLEKGALIDMQQYDGWSSLMIASQNGHAEVIQLLIEKGARIDMQQNDRWSALMIASHNGHTEVIKLLLENGAQVDMQNNEGKTSLMLAAASSGQMADTILLLLEYGAKIDLQDNDGWFPLMYAAQTGDLEVCCLLASGANLNMKNFAGETVFDICSHTFVTSSLYQDLLQSLLFKENDSIRIDSNYPKVYFFKEPMTEHITSSDISIDGLGISVSIPEDSLHDEEKFLDLSIHPCFSGPFELPENYESASPTYLITHSRRVTFSKDITVRMHHYACLRSEEDCEDMVFFSASSVPEYRDSNPVYIFKEIQGSKGIFRPGDQVGEIALRHFCLIIIGKRKRADVDDEKLEDSDNIPKIFKGNESFYSVRLYRNLNPSHEASAVFCMCLCDPIYIQHCDEKIIERYTGTSLKGEGLSQTFAEIISDEVFISATSSTGWNVRFDKEPTKILKREIHLPELLRVRVSDLLDYPPKFLAYIKAATSTTSDPPKLQVKGLDIENFSFEILTPKLLLQCRQSVDYQSGIPPSHEQMNDIVVVNPAIQSSTLTSEEMLTSIDDKILNIDDLGDVLEAVMTLAAEWKVFATILRLKQHTIDAIQHDNSKVMTCLNAALGEWLKLNYDTRVHDKPSWRTLAERVQKLNQGLFEKISRDHPAQSHASS